MSRLKLLDETGGNWVVPLQTQAAAQAYQTDFNGHSTF